MTTFPRGRRNQLGLGSFADLTDVAVVRIDKSGVEFADDLPEDECAAVWARIESTDDADQAARATLRAAIAAVAASPTLPNVAALAVLQAKYCLGDIGEMQ